MLDALKKKDQASSSSDGGGKAPEHESNTAKRKRVANEMLKKYGKDDKGREPCFFHHIEGARTSAGSAPTSAKAVTTSAMRMASERRSHRQKRRGEG